MLTTQDKHNPGGQRVARLYVSLAQSVDWERAVKIEQLFCNIKIEMYSFNFK